MDTASDRRADPPDPSRRALIRRAAVLGAAVAAGMPLMACSAGRAEPSAVQAPADEVAVPVPDELAAVPDEFAPAPGGRAARAAAEPAPAVSSRPEEAAEKKGDKPADGAGKDEAGGDGKKRGGEAKPDGDGKTPGGEEKKADKPPPAEKADKPPPAEKADKPPPAEKPGELTPEGEPVAATTEVPVGSGALFESEELVVTQPAAGDFRGFSMFCPHEGCLVDIFQPGKMVCSCHNSTFALDGRPLSGPAGKPLPMQDIVVVDGQIFRAVPRR